MEGIKFTQHNNTNNITAIIGGFPDIKVGIIYTKQFLRQVMVGRG
jgi:hypothetical protein